MNDLLLAPNYDLQTANGDLVIGDATQQHILLHCETAKGEWKEWPTVGLGLRQRIFSIVDAQGLRRNMLAELGADGFNTVDIIVDEKNEKFEIVI